jgi:purine-binding chemotaxis protein CheW
MPDKISRVPATISEGVFNENSAEDETHRLLAFLLGGEEYGINILMFREIIRLAEITPVPGAPSCIKGIISLRGAVLPILNLHQLLSMPETQPDKKSRILVVNLEAGPVGVIVDAVTGIVDLKEAEIEPPPTVTTRLETDHIKGMGRYKGRLIILLEPDKVYTTRQGRMSSRAGQEAQTLP